VREIQISFGKNIRAKVTVETKMRKATFAIPRKLRLK